MSEPQPFTAVVVPADEAAPIRVVTVAPGLEPLRSLLDGGWLEALYLAYASLPGMMYFDEEGKLKGLPANRFANALAPLRGDVLVGPVVYVGGPDNEGDDMDVPESLVEMIADLAAVMGRRMEVE